MRYLSAKDEDMQSQLRSLAQEVVSEITAVDPARSRELLSAFVSELVLAVADESRREERRQRQAEGIAAAKARGVRFGRPPRPLPENYHSAYQRWKSGVITGTAAAKECGMPLSTFRYRAEIYEKAKLL